MKRKLKQMIEETADSCEEGFNKITMPLDEVNAVAKILKASLRLMIVKQWNGKDFTNIDELSGMANDIIEVISEVGNG